MYYLIYYTYMQIIKLLRRDIDLRSIVEEFGKLIYEEIDYLQEARNAQVLSFTCFTGTKVQYSDAAGAALR